MPPSRFMAVLAAILLTTAPAAAEMDQKKIAAAQKAAADFVKLAGNAAKTGKPPRATDPGAKALIDTAFDTSAMITPEFSDIPRITQWLANADRIGLVYMMAGTGSSNLAAAANPKIADRIGKNIAAFQDEYGRFVDFQLALSGFTLDAVRSRMDKAPEKERHNPKVQAGFMQVGSAITQTIAGTIATFTTEGITDEWRRARLTSLNAIMPQAAHVLPSAMKAKLGEFILDIGGQMSDAQIKDDIKAMAETLTK